MMAAVAWSFGQTKSISASPVPPVPRVIQGSIESISGSILVVQGSSALGPNGRQVDVSRATFDDGDGKPIPRPRFVIGDRILVIVDGSAPVTEGPPKGKGGGPHPMFMRLLPLRALVVERISSQMVRTVSGKG